MVHPSSSPPAGTPTAATTAGVAVVMQRQQLQQQEQSSASSSSTPPQGVVSSSNISSPAGRHRGGGGSSRSGPSPSRGGGGRGGGGRGGPSSGPRGATSSPHHHQHQHHRHQGGGGRESVGGRHLYHPNHPRSPATGAPDVVQAIHQQSGIPHGHVPAYLCGSASLVEELDAVLMVVLRDGRHLVGTLTSYDQFSNLVLEDTVERRYLNGPEHKELYYADIPLGLYVVRGESVVLMGRTVNSPGNGPSSVGQLVTLDELEVKRKGFATKAQSSPEQELDWDVDTDLIA